MNPFRKRTGFGTSKNFLEKRLRVEKPAYLELYRETDPALLASLREKFTQQMTSRRRDHAQKKHSEKMLKHVDVLSALCDAERALMEKNGDAYLAFGEKYPSLFHGLTQETTPGNVTAKTALADHLRMTGDGKYAANLKMNEHISRLYKEAAHMAATLDDEIACTAALSGYCRHVGNAVAGFAWAAQTSQDAMVVAVLTMRCDDEEDKRQGGRFLCRLEKDRQLRVVWRLTAPCNDWSERRLESLLYYLQAAQEKEHACLKPHIETLRALIDPEKFDLLSADAAERFGPGKVGLFYALTIGQMQRGTQEVIETVLPTTEASNRFLDGYNAFCSRHKGNTQDMTWESLACSEDASSRMAMHCVRQIYDAHVEMRGKLKNLLTAKDKERMHSDVVLMVDLLYKVLSHPPENPDEMEEAVDLTAKIICMENERKILDYVHGDDNAMPEDGLMLMALKDVPGAQKAVQEKVALQWYKLLGVDEETGLSALKFDGLHF